MFKRILLIRAATLVVILGTAVSGVYWFLSGDSIRSALEHQATAWLRNPVHIGSATAQFTPRVSIDLRDVRAGELASVTLTRVNVSAPLRPLLVMRSFTHSIS